MWMIEWFRKKKERERENSRHKQKSAYVSMHTSLQFLRVSIQPVCQNVAFEKTQPQCIDTVEKERKANLYLYLLYLLRVQNPNIDRKRRNINSFVRSD